MTFDQDDLVKLAQKLASEGPHKIVPTPRRVRGLFNGKYVFDTTKAYHVWEHPWYPQFYIPLSSITPAATLTKSSAIPDTNSTVHLATLTVSTKSTSRILLFTTALLPSLLKIDFPALDIWFEESLPIYQHPKDLFKRVDILPSTRHIKIELHGSVLAESAAPLVLYETGLRPRWYLPPTSVRWEVLRKSETVTYCPYKGRANYYNLVWYYVYPTKESIEVAGYLCFYNEKVDVWVDGKLEKR
ncbi:DUF427-domain-containing protein [Lophiostoma macrostomum CBS 122681]|uniref:DUF427-domain-containing protein n=1 Tax=Lophiostoma macrostomum CBS 122681 TaxID=1314788 RepID=A0A6A6SIT0_9PLEO|nr:DUF427-domain-containing protein [Lophiostoma macrostomum CBS 122681]